MESPTVVSIDRRHQLSYEEFAEEYLFPGKPLIITGAINGWRALDNWTPEYFNKKIWIEFVLSPETLKAANKLGARIVFTVYAPERPRKPSKSETASGGPTI